MKKILLTTLPAILLVLASCGTISSSGGGTTEKDSPVQHIKADYFGFVDHYSTPKKEEEAAKEEVIRQILIEDKLVVNLYHYQRQTSVDTVSFGKMDYIWSEKNADSLREKIEVKKFITDDKGTWAYADYRGNPALRAIPSPEIWSVEEVKIPGYRCFTGFAERLSTEGKSIREADDNALAQAVRYLSLSISDEVESYESTYYSYATVKTKEEAILIIRGFRVIDRWEKDGVYYSLAVIPE